MKYLKQKFNDLNLRKKLIILLCLVGFVPVLLLTVYISVYSYRTVLKNKQADMEKSLELACASVESQMSICAQMMEYFVYDQNLLDFLACSPDQKTERYGYYQELRNAVAALQYQNLAMRSVTIYSDAIPHSFGENTQPLKELTQETWYEPGAEDGKWYVDAEKGELVSLYRIPQAYGHTGYAAVRTDMNVLFQSFTQLAEGESGVSVYDGAEIWKAAGEACADQAGAPCSFGAQGQLYVWTEAWLKNPDARVVFFQPRPGIQMVSWNLVVWIVALTAACLLIIILLGRRFADYISSPLELLTEEIRTVDEERMGTEIQSDRTDEAGILIRSYNRMMKRIRELIQENYKTRIAQKEFELKALQAQINPHFLYNSLSIINWKAIEAGEEEISRITLALSAFYRTTLNKGKTMISIRMAMENIRAYLQLQLWMHDHDFQVHYEVDEGAFDEMIPSLIFQPFVENALEHGLDVKEDPDHQIWICIRQGAETVSVEIRDNGVGMDEDTLNHILEYQAAGYGVKNVNDRMILHYGEAYGIRIHSAPGEGTAVMLTFPRGQKEKM